MLLHRVTLNPFEGGDISSHNIGQYAGSAAISGTDLILKFDRFGTGARRSDFEVTISWSDVEQFIATFSQARHPEALEFKNALQLAKALKEAGWRPPEISN
jgi:hypothetical protein